MLASLARALIVRPASAILNPFRLVWKVLIVLVLLAIPLGVVISDYVGQQSNQIAFASREQSGLTLVGPADQLMADLVLGRHAAVAGQPVTNSLSSAVSAVDTADSQVGTTLSTHGQWASARSAVSSAQSASGDPSQVFQSWSTAISAVQSYLVAVADASNLTLDPELDTYYLQDALTVQLPAYLAAQGRAVDLGSFDSNQNLDQGLAQGAAAQALAAAQSDLTKAMSNASDSAVAGQLAPLSQALGNASKSDIATTAQTIGNQSATATAAEDQLLASRISNLQGGELRNELMGIILGAIALWLCIGILVQAGEATTKLVKTMEEVAAGDVTVQTDLVGQDEFGQVAKHLNAALAKVRESLQVISEKTQKVLVSSRDLFSVSSEMSGTAESVSDRAAAVSAASEQVNTNVTVVAAAIEEMVASVKEIASNASKASEVATRASDIAAVAGENIARLEASSVEISNVVSLITSIAEQTNLLALNATIEAARAGEMGKGFAVVANEVKDLAAKTTKATEDISHRIEAIQANTQSATESVTQIRQIVGEINDIQGSIASSVEEQAAAVSEVGRSVAEAATSTGTIVDNITGVATSARGNREMAQKNLGSAEGLSTVSNELQSLIGKLLGEFHFENGNAESAGRITKV